MTDIEPVSEELAQIVDHPAHAVVAQTMASIGMPSPAEWAALTGMAAQLARSRLVAPTLRGQPDDIMLILLTGRDLGIAPTQALSKVHVIEGKPSLAPELMTALVRRAGYPIWPDPANDRTKATVHTQRDGREYSFTFSLDDAVVAGLCRIEDGKPVARSDKNRPLPWETYTQFMLWARAVSGLCRMVYADVLMGVSYTPEELGAVVDATGEPVEVSSDAYRPVGEPSPDDLARRDGWESKADYEAHWTQLEVHVKGLGERDALRFWAWMATEGITLPGPKEGWQKAWDKVIEREAKRAAETPTLANDPPSPPDPERTAAAQASLEAAQEAYKATEPPAAPPAEESAYRDVTPEELAIVANLAHNDPVVTQVLNDTRQARITFVDEELAARGLLHGPESGSADVRRRRLQTVLIVEEVGLREEAEREAAAEDLADAIASEGYEPDVD